MGVYKFRSLPHDTARCYGSNCTLKETCMRYKQIELDKQYNSDNNWIWYTDSPRSGDACEIRMGIDP